MSVLVRGRNISKSFGEFKLIQGIDLEIKENEVIGIVGCNGCGKSTLLEMLVGRIPTDSGQWKWLRPHCQVSYMPQVANEEIRQQRLSCGEQTKKRLQRALYQPHELLVLDEPTNHLDQKGIQWLIQMIRKEKGTVIIVSHDRYFLDQCAQRIIELENGKLQHFLGNYSDYQMEKKKQLEAQKHAYMIQEKRQQKIKAEMARLKNWSQKAHEDAAQKAIETGNKFGGKEHNRAKAKKRDQQIKSKLKRLEKMQEESIEKPREQAKIQFTLEKAEKGNKRILEVKQLGKSYGNKVLFADSHYSRTTF